MMISTRCKNKRVKMEDTDDPSGKILSFPPPDMLGKSLSCIKHIYGGHGLDALDVLRENPRFEESPLQLEENFSGSVSSSQVLAGAFSRTSQVLIRAFSRSDMRLLEGSGGHGKYVVREFEKIQTEAWMGQEVLEVTAI